MRPLVLPLGVQAGGVSALYLHVTGRTQEQVDDAVRLIKHMMVRPGAALTLHSRHDTRWP